MDFTVVLPVYKRTTYFRKALDSVLAQSVKPKIIVHDASPTDVGFRDLIGRDTDRVAYHHFTDGRGIGGDWNRAMSLVQTEWFSFLHQDDWLEPDFCASFRADLEKGPPFGIWICSTSERDEGSSERIVQAPDLYTRDRSKIGRLLLVDPVFRCAAVALSRKTVRQVGEFDERIRHTLDSELFVRAALGSGVRFNPKVLAYYRLHAGSTTGVATPCRWGFNKVPIMDDHRLLQDHRIFLLKQPKENLADKEFRRYSSNIVWLCFRYYLQRLRLRSLLQWFICWRHHVYLFSLGPILQRKSTGLLPELIRRRASGSSASLPKARNP